MLYSRDVQSFIIVGRIPIEIIQWATELIKFQKAYIVRQLKPLIYPSFFQTFFPIAPLDNKQNIKHPLDISFYYSQHPTISQSIAKQQRSKVTLTEISGKEKKEEKRSSSNFFVDFSLIFRLQPTHNSQVKNKKRHLPIKIQPRFAFRPQTEENFKQTKK